MCITWLIAFIHRHVAGIDESITDPAYGTADQLHEKRSEWKQAGDVNGTLDNARIWTLYGAEARKHDSVQLDTWNRTLDVLLLLAALLSATLTTFIVDSYHSLEADPVDYMASVIAIWAADPASFSSNKTRTLLPTSPSSFKPNSSARWVNGLWAASLVCTLAVALVSMLVKQWLQSYTIAEVSGDARDWARKRQYRLSALYNWRVCCIITALPILLHASLLLFFVGLLLLFWTLDVVMGGLISILVLSIFAFYGITMIMPIFYPDCPFKSPVLPFMTITWSWLWSKTQSAKTQPIRTGARKKNQKGSSSRAVKGIIRDHWHGHVVTDHFTDQLRIKPREDLFDAEALSWLLEITADKETTREIFRVIPALSQRPRAIDAFRTSDVHIIAQRLFLQCFHRLELEQGSKYIIRDISDAIIYCHAMVCLSSNVLQNWPIAVVESLWEMQGSNNDEARVLASCALSRHRVSHAISRLEVLEHLRNVVEKRIAISSNAMVQLLEDVTGYVAEGTLSTSDVLPTLIGLLHEMQYADVTDVGRTVRQALKRVVLKEDKVPCPQCALRIEGSCYCFYKPLNRALVNILKSPTAYGMKQLTPTVAEELARLTWFAISLDNTRHTDASTGLSSGIADATSALATHFLDGSLTTGELSQAALTSIIRLLTRSLHHLPYRHPAFTKRLIELIKLSTTEDTLRTVLGLFEQALDNVAFGLEMCCVFNTLGGMQTLVNHGLVVNTQSIGQRVQDMVVSMVRKLACTLMKRHEMKGDNHDFKTLTGDLLASGFIGLTFYFFKGTPYLIPQTTYFDLSYIMHVLYRHHPDDHRWQRIVPEFEAWIHQCLEQNAYSDALLEAWAHVLTMVDKME